MLDSLKATKGPSDFHGGKEFNEATGVSSDKLVDMPSLLTI